MTLTQLGAIKFDCALLICQLRGRKYRNALRIAESLQRQLARVKDDGTRFNLGNDGIGKDDEGAKPSSAV